MKVLVINPGATSTKISVFDEEREILRKSINHPIEEIASFARIIDQKDYRKNMILDTLSEAGFSLSDFDAVSGRGGLTKHIPSGTYRISDAVIEDISHSNYGEHAANLGTVLAREFGDEAGIPSFFVDPICVDEFSELARISGFKGMVRESFFHALNQKRMARKAASILGRAYEDVILVVCHLGGGISVAAHDHGRVVDVTNVKDDGAMGLDRGGGLPVNKVIDFCFAHGTKAEVKKILGEQSGVYSYLGTKDFKQIEENAFGGDDYALLIFRAYIYQLAEDIGSMAAVLHFDVDGIVLTGGIAYSDRFCAELSEYVSRLARVIRLPGEEEMQALADGALRVLHGEAPKEY